MQEQSSDAVLVTAPLCALKAGAITYAPALPARKERAIAALGIGHLSKVFFRFESTIWDISLHGFGYLGPTVGAFFQWVNIAQTNDSPILMAFHGGRMADALETQSDAEILEGAMQVLQQIWG